jgi:hypothetical protein
MALTRAEIQAAIKCEGWQAFRKDLKGIPTDIKLERLTEYVSPRTWKMRRQSTSHFVFKTEDGDLCCDYDKRCVQVINYLGALSRAGHIEPVIKSWAQKQFIERWLVEQRYKVVT